MAELRTQVARLERAATEAKAQPGFAKSLNRVSVGIIAEVKRASPSKGPINPSLDVRAQCGAYERGGAAAISILTEPTRFSGSLDDLCVARSVSALPLLRKDFILDRLQLLEARSAGASSVLLIARALEPGQLEDLFAEAVAIGLEPLVEIRSEGELGTALGCGAELVGVNNRNLETLETSDIVSMLMPLIPRRCIAVAESGYRTAADVEAAARSGADAVLIGSELSRATSAADVLRALTTIKRSRDVRAD